MKPDRTGPRYTRGAVLLDYYRLYVVLDSWLSGEAGSHYKVLIIAMVGAVPADAIDHPGMFTTWGEGVHTDQYVGETELPATL